MHSLSIKTHPVALQPEDDGVGVAQRTAVHRARLAALLLEDVRVAAARLPEHLDRPGGRGQRVPGNLAHRGLDGGLIFGVRIASRLGDQSTMSSHKIILNFCLSNFFIFFSSMTR